MFKSFRLLAVLMIVSTSVAWSAKPKPKAKVTPKATSKATPKAVPVKYTVSMQSVGTFEDQPAAAKMSIVTSPDEFEPGSFVVKTNKAISGLSVSMEGDLKSGKNSLAAEQGRVSAVDGDNLLPVQPVDLQPGESRRYWLTLGAPKGTVPGTYSGAVLATAGGKTVGRLPIAVTVLPLDLTKSSKQYGYTLRTVGSGVVPDPKTLCRLPEYGFTLTSVATPPESLGDAARALKEAGLDSTTLPYTCPGMSIDQVVAANASAKACGVSRLYCEVDSGSSQQADIDSAYEIAQAARQQGIRTIAIINDPAAYEKLVPVVDYTDLDFDLPYVQGLLAGEKPANLRHDWVHWDIMASAQTNRLNAGLILWRTGLFGAFIPYRASDAVSDGVEPLLQTIQGEALREGVDDTRYITTMMKALREIKDAVKVGGTKNVVAANQTAGEAETYMTAVMAKPLKDLKNQDCQDIRAKLAKYSIKLNSLLKH